MAKTMRRVFRGQRKRLNAKFNEIYKSSLSADDVARLLFDINVENPILRSEAIRVYTILSLRAWNSIDSDLARPDKWFREYIARNTASLVVRINETTRHKIKLLVNNSFQEEGHTVASIQDRLRQSLDLEFHSMYNNRALTVARTESMFVHNNVAVNKYTELGVQKLDVVGCTEFETYSDCGARNVPIHNAGNLRFHPNHIGVLVPS